MSSLPTSECLFAEPAQTLIFLDFDDTLFPTTELFDRWGLPSRPETWGTLELSEAQESSLETWRHALLCFLSTVCAKTERCVIVTNAKRPWVEQCVARFVPELLPALDAPRGPQVVYAREVCVSAGGLSRRGGLQPAFCTDKGEEERNQRFKSWKHAAMLREARSFYAKYPGQTWKNILSMGDMPYEHNALLDVTFQRRGPAREQLRSKSVIAPPGDSIEAFALWLRVMALMLPVVVAHDGDVDVDLSNAPDRLEALAKALEMDDSVGLGLDSLFKVVARACDSEDEGVRRALRQLQVKAEDFLL